MLSGATTASSAMAAMQSVLRVTSDNLANGATTGYQAFRAMVTQLNYVEVQKPGMATVDGNSVTPYGSYVGTGVKSHGTYRDMTPGDIQQDNSPFHMAIVGNGYFQVLLPNAKGGQNVAYTRSGRFMVKNQRLVLENTGMNISDEITVPPTIDINTINIGPSGIVTGFNTANNTTETLGQVTLWRFDNEQGLQSSDYGLFLANDASGDGVRSVPGDGGSGKIQDRALEDSNVNLYQELLLLNKVVRISEACAQVIKQSGNMEDAAIETLKA